jgi:uncharacterized protein YqjF (DUF2071 family)
MNSTIPLLGGVPLSAGRVSFIFPYYSNKIEKKRSKDEILTSSSKRRWTPQDDGVGG